MDDVDAFLEHVGVKGMKWGVRKDPSAGRESRKDYKARVKTEKDEFYNKKIQGVVKQSLAKGNDILIQTRLPGDAAITIATGKDFLNHVSAGGVFDAKVTDVFATKNSDGNYERVAPSEGYVKSKRR